MRKLRSRVRSPLIWREQELESLEEYLDAGRAIAAGDESFRSVMRRYAGRPLVSFLCVLQLAVWAAEAEGVHPPKGSA